MAIRKRKKSHRNRKKSNRLKAKFKRKEKMRKARWHK